MASRTRNDVMIERLLSGTNTKAASLALFLFTYLILALSIFSIPYKETVHRLTMFRVFDESLFGSTMMDSLAAIGFMLLFLSLSSRLPLLRIVSITVFAVAIAGIALGSPYLVNAGMATLPIIAGLLIDAKLAAGKKTKVNRRPPITSGVQVDYKRVA
ncbi:MAG: hypothetical protein ACREBU_25430, partial [Nitrososphaera sp.]